VSRQWGNRDGKRRKKGTWRKGGESQQGEDKGTIPETPKTEGKKSRGIGKRLIMETEKKKQTGGGKPKTMGTSPPERELKVEEIVPHEKKIRLEANEEEGIWKRISKGP